MKKRMMGLAVLLFWAVAGVYSQSQKIWWGLAPDDWNQNHTRFFFFNGFDFMNLTPDAGQGLEQTVNADLSFVRNTPEAESGDTAGKTGKLPRYLFTGYSQGGLRSLAAASILSKTNRAEYNRVNGIVTISGIDRGFEGLAGGAPVLRQKLLARANILYRGGKNSADMIGYISLLALGIDPLSASVFVESNRLLVPDSLEEANRLLCLLIWPFTIKDITDQTLGDNWVYNLLAGDTSKIPEINDMDPESEFLSDHILSTKPKYETRQRKIGERALRRVRFEPWDFLKWFPITYYVYEPIYEYYRVQVGELPTIQIGEEMPIGYIVGANNNTLGMAGGEAENTIRTVAKALDKTFDAAAIYHMTRTVVFLGYFWGTVTDYQDCVNARNLVSNLDREINLIKGSPENDGLVTVNYQYFPKSVHNNTLGESAGYTKYPQYNHKNIISATEVHNKINTMLQEAHSRRVITP